MQKYMTYLGNKRKLVDFILDLVRSKVPSNGTILDLFSGSGVVAHKLRQAQYVVHANDIAAYSKFINISNLEIDFDLSHFDSKILEINSLKSPINEFYFSLHYSDPKRLFFTRENGLFIDAALEVLHCLSNEYKTLKAVLLADLLVKMSIHNNTGGHFKSFYKQLGGRNQERLTRIAKPIQLEKPELLKAPVGKAFQMDAIQFLSNCDTYDLIYLDPPYCGHQYSGNYHLLEAACLPFKQRYIPEDTQISGIDPFLYKSPYSQKKACYQEFLKLIDLARLKTKCVVFSYNAKGFLSKDEIRSTLEKFGQVDLIEINHVTYRGGFARPNAARPPLGVNEYLFVLTPCGSE